MNPNDETIYQPLEEQDRVENNEVKEEKVTPKSENKGGGWAKLTIGGVTGIFMGAGAMYAGKPYVDDATEGWKESLYAWAEENGLVDKLPWLKPKHDESQIAGNDDNTDGQDGGIEDGPQEQVAPETAPATETAHASHAAQPEPHLTQASYVPSELHVATVDQDQSFADAFAQARAEVGPGGVFHWHGGVFNTYTEAEWNAMTPADRSDFAHQVAPEVQHRLDISDDIAYQTAPDSSANETVTDTNVDNPDEADVIMVDDQESASDSDVHILGVTQGVNEDGSISTAGISVIDGEPVVMIDGDGDNVFDVMWHDDNLNNQIETNEVIDISDRGLTVDEFAAMAVEQGNSEDGTFNFESSSTPQDELAQDMPDYTNDADTSGIYEA